MKNINTHKATGVKIMKKLFVGVLVALGIVSSGVAQAAATATVPVTVVVPQQLDLTADVYSIPGTADPATMNPFDGTKVTSMNFGTLRWDSDWSVWRADNFFTVILVARTSGRPYRITQTCAGIVNGSNNLNKNILMTPGYQAQDSLTTAGTTPQGAMPSGASLGSSGAKVLAVGANKLIYNSGTSTGLTRIVRAYYGLATGNTADNEPVGSEPASADALAGSYSGSITFSVVLN